MARDTFRDKISDRGREQLHGVVGEGKRECRERVFIRHTVCPVETNEFIFTPTETSLFLGTRHFFTRAAPCSLTAK